MTLQESRVANIKQHRYLLDFLIYGNKKEKVAFLKDYQILMMDQQFKSLQKHKSFIRKVARGKATSTILARNHKILSDIIKIILNHYEICTKISSGSYRRVGQKKQKDLPLKQVMVNTLPQKVVTSQQVKVTPQQGLGKIHVKNPVEKKLKEMILSLSPKRRMKALTILKLIKKSKDFSWAENGEFIYKGKSILLSDIKTLIIHTLQNTNDKPKGMAKFYKALSTLDLPKNIIVNKTGRSLIKKF